MRSANLSDVFSVEEIEGHFETGVSSLNGRLAGFRT